MKTTIEISKLLFEKTKKYAYRQGLTFRAVTEQALSQFLNTENKTSKKFHLRRGSFKGKGLSAGIQEGDWVNLREQIYEGRGA